MFLIIGMDLYAHSIEILSILVGFFIVMGTCIANSYIERKGCDLNEG